MSDHYGAQVRTQLAEARARSARYRAAWQSARRRAAECSAAVDHTVAAAERGVNDLGRIAHDQLIRAEKAEADLRDERATSADRARIAEGLRQQLASVQRIAGQQETRLNGLLAVEDDLHQAEAQLAAVRAFAADMRTWCSPHGIAADYADRLEAALNQQA